MIFFSSMPHRLASFRIVVFLLTCYLFRASLNCLSGLSTAGRAFLLAFEKACDWVDWDFFDCVLLRMGFLAWNTSQAAQKGLLVDIWERHSISSYF